MAKQDKEDLFRVIPFNERTPEMEEKVKYWLSITPSFPENTIKHKRARDYDGKDPLERDLYRRQEIQKIKTGANGMCGKMYFWYNYVKMTDVDKGLIRPEFRVAQNEWFKQIEWCQQSREWGLVCVKRRRVGASWLEAADVLHDCITNSYHKVGMTSKTEHDGVLLFNKVKFIYDNLPEWLRPTSSAGNTRTSIDFSWKERDSKGSLVKKGTQSEILVKPPTDTAWEGAALKKLVLDEAGKIANLKTIFSLAQDTMMVGFTRVGIPVIFGTAGDISKEGLGLMELWHQSDIHKLKQFFFGGWMGLSGFVDEFGNDMKEDAIRWIVYERKRIESLSTKEYTTFIQKYPLTVQEAFKANHEVGIGDKIKINRQRESLLTHPVQKKQGYFKLDGKETVTFVPDKRGACTIFEEPEPAMRNLYLGGCDPTDHDTDRKNVSNLSMFIMKKPSGLTPPRIVFEYTDRPNVPRDFYEQALMALLYYNKAKVLIERNKYGMITYFDERGYKHLMATTPQGMTRLIGGNTFNIGYYATKATNHYGEGLVEEYIEDYWDQIPSIELLNEFDEYGLKNTDRVSAMFACLMLLKEDKTVSKQAAAIKRHIPDWDYRKVNGVIKLNRGH